MKVKCLRGVCVMLAGAFLLLGCSGCGYVRSLFSRLFGGRRGASGAINNELAYQEARGRVVGEFLKNATPGKKLVIIADANSLKDRFTMQLIDSLKKAYGAESEIDSVPIPPNAEEEGTPAGDYMTAKALDALIAKHPDVGAVLFMSGLPENPERLKIFSADPRPAIMLIGRGGASDKFLVDKIKSGEITGLVLGRPNVKYSEPADSNYKKAFDFRYVLINKDNVDSNAEFFK